MGSVYCTSLRAPALGLLDLESLAPAVWLTAPLHSEYDEHCSVSLNTTSFLTVV